MGVALASLMGIKKGLLASPTVFKPQVELVGDSLVIPKVVPTEYSVKKSLMGASFVIAYSSAIDTDSKAAQGLHALLPGSQLLPIADSPHGVVYPLARRHHLLEVLSRSFGITAEPRIEI